MVKLKKFILLILILTFSISLLSCYDYRETSDLAIVNGMAIDKTKDDKILLTIEYTKISSGEGTIATTGELATIEGLSLFDAARNAISKVGKKLYWGHAKVVIIDKAIAESGISSVIDWINRDSEMRSEMFFLIAYNCEAREIFTESSKKNLIVSDNIYKIVLAQKNLSKAEYNKDLVWIHQYLSRKEVALTTPIIYLDYKSNKVTPVVSGSAVFKRDKMIGTLNGDETKAMLFLRNSLKGGLIVLQNISNTGSSATLEVFESKTKHKVSYDSGRITINFIISPTVNIGELNSAIDFTDLKKLEELKNFADKKLERDVNALIEKVKKNNFGDICDFAKLIKIPMPDVWRNVEPNWEKDFNNVHIIVNADIKFKGSARTSKSIKTGE